MDKEVWKDIKGYIGIYQISNHGRVKSLSRTVVYSNGNTRVQKERIMSIKPTASHKYPNVNLYSNKKPTLTLVHRLVAEYFVDNPNPSIYKYVNHKDGDRANNYYENLEWCTHKQNIQHSVNTGLYNCKGNNNHQAKSVVNCRGEVFGTVKEAADAYGMKSSSGVSAVCRGLRESSGTYKDGTRIKWKYHV